MPPRSLVNAVIMHALFIIKNPFTKILYPPLGYWDSTYNTRNKLTRSHNSWRNTSTTSAISVIKALADLLLSLRPVLNMFSIEQTFYLIVIVCIHGYAFHDMILIWSAALQQIPGSSSSMLYVCIGLECEWSELTKYNCLFITPNLSMMNM